MLSYKFRLYPKKRQEERLMETLELCRQTYNYFLAQWNGKESIPSRLELQAQLPKLKEERSAEQGLLQSFADGSLSAILKLEGFIATEEEWKEGWKATL